MYNNTQGGGNSMAMPDVCKTPTPAGPIPTPYPNTAMGETANVATASIKVLIMNMNAHTLQTMIPLTDGDDAGVAGGVVSSMFIGPARWAMGAVKVMIEGQPATCQGDPTEQNGTPPNAVGSTAAPAQAKVESN